jgi:hypothetical protein
MWAVVAGCYWSMKGGAGVPKAAVVPDPGPEESAPYNSEEDSELATVNDVEEAAPA